MKRSKYLAKKFEYYEHMKKLRQIEHVVLIERLKLEIELLESRVRSKLIDELVEHLTSDRIKENVIKEVKKRVYSEVIEEIKENMAKGYNMTKEELFGKKKDLSGKPAKESLMEKDNEVEKNDTET